MTGIQAIGVLIIRFWAASVILPYFVTYAIWIIGAFMGEPSEDVASLVIEGIIWIATALGAWIFAPRLSRLLAPRDAPDAVKLSMNAEDFVATGSFLIGGFLTLQTAPGLVAGLLEIIGQFAARESDELPTIIAYQWQRLFASALTVAIVLFMTLRPRELARLFASLRQAGLAKVEPGD